MPQKKEPTPAQLAARKKFGEQARARAAAKKNNLDEITPEVKIETPEIQSEQSSDELLKQLRQTQETVELLKAALLNGNQQNNNSAQLSNNRVVGEVEKYLVDPALYPDPTKRLYDEPQLAPFAFKINYELDYSVSISQYETRTGINMKEPKFMVQLNRVVLDDKGLPTSKRYIARQMVFHEDPQAAMVIARDNGIEIPESDQDTWLNEMRYLRIRDWLLDIFYPKPAQEQEGINEEVIGGTIVRVFNRNSEEPGSIPFQNLARK